MNHPTITRIRGLGTSLFELADHAKKIGWDESLSSGIKAWGTTCQGVAVALLAECTSSFSGFDMVLANSPHRQRVSESLQSLGTELRELSSQIWTLGNDLSALRGQTETCSLDKVAESMVDGAGALVRLAGILDSWWTASRQSMFSPAGADDSVNEAETMRVVRDTDDTADRLRVLRTEVPVALAAVGANRLPPSKASEPASSEDGRAKLDSEKSPRHEDSPIANVLEYDPPLVFPEKIPPLLFIEQPLGAVPRFRQWILVMATKIPTVFIGRESQEALSETYPQSEPFVQRYWLSKVGEGSTPVLNPMELDKLAECISSHMEGDGEHGVALEGIDYLCHLHTFDAVLRLLYVLRDTATQHRGHIAVLLNPERFEERELALLEGTGERVLPEVVIGRSAQDLYK